MTMHINRGFARKYNKAPILFSDNGNPQSTTAIMYDYSVDGMHFISDFFIRPGSDICIEILDKTYHSHIPENLCNTRQAQVVWCRKSNSHARFAVGVRFSRSAK